MPKYLMLLIYIVKSKSIKQNIEAMEDPICSEVFFLDNVDYEGGVTVTVCFYKNQQVRLFSILQKKLVIIEMFFNEFYFLVRL